jgi:hypothetical protein
MHFSWNFLYTFWIITALHLISTYFTTYHIASHHVASPRLTLLHIASHNIASGHTLHRIRSHLASHLVTPHIVSHRPGRFTSSVHSHSIRTNQYHHNKTKKAWIVRSTSISRTYTMGLIVPGTFRWSTPPPRLGGDRKDETLHTGARLFRARSGMVVSRRPSTLAGYRPKLEPGSHDRTGAGSS